MWSEPLFETDLNKLCSGPSGRAVSGVGLGRSPAENVGSNPAGALISVSCECCVLPGTGLCVGLITLPEESYRVWCV